MVRVGASEISWWRIWLGMRYPCNDPLVIITGSDNAVGVSITWVEFQRIGFDQELVGLMGVSDDCGEGVVDGDIGGWSGDIIDMNCAVVNGT